MVVPGCVQEVTSNSAHALSDSFTAPFSLPRRIPQYSAIPAVPVIRNFSPPLPRSRAMLLPFPPHPSEQNLGLTAEATALQHDAACLHCCSGLPAHC